MMKHGDGSIVSSFFSQPYIKFIKPYLACHCTLQWLFYAFIEMNSL